MTFRQAVEATAAIKDAWKPGIQGLRHSDRNRIHAQDTRRLKGSVNLDETLETAFPNTPRWDYAIGYQRAGETVDTVYWVEIHQATKGEIKNVLSKLTWLKKWLTESAPSLDALPSRFRWVSSGRTSIEPSSPQAKKLAEHGLSFTGRALRVS